MMAPDHSGGWRLALAFVIVGVLVCLGTWKAMDWVYAHVTLRWEQMP